MKASSLPPRAWLLTGTALILGTAVGYFIGRHQFATASPLAPSSPATESLSQYSPLGASVKFISAAASTRTAPLIPRGASIAQTLRQILGIPDTLDRLAALKAWCLELPPGEVSVVLAEFQKMMEAQETVGDLAAVSLLLQSIDVLAQALMEKGPATGLHELLTPTDGKDPTDLQEATANALFAKWAAQDLPAALAFLGTRLTDPDKIGNTEKELTKNLMREWVKTDPDAAMAWLEKQPEHLAKDTISSAFQSLSHVNSAKALQLVEAQSALPGRDKIATDIAAWWAKESPNEALKWASALPENLATASVPATIATWLQNDFSAARKAVDSLSPSLKDATLPTLVSNWKDGKWNEAASYLDQQPAGTGRDQALGQLVRNWADSNQEQASAWLAAQPASPSRDLGVQELANEVRKTDPEAAAIWGATLTDPKMRQISLQNTLRSWYSKSLPAAVNWLQTAPQLTDTDRNTLMGTLPPK